MDNSLLLVHESSVSIIAEITYIANSENATTGQVVPHSQVVNNVIVFAIEFNNGHESRNCKIYLSRDNIMQAADKIKNIESEKISKPYEDLPW